MLYRHCFSTLEYATRRVQVNRDGLKLNNTYKLLVYAYDVNILGGSVHTKKENVEPLVIASKEIGLEVNADKTKYMVMFRDQNAGRSHNVKIDSKSLERVEEFRYLDITPRNQNSIYEENKSRLKSWNACYHSVQNFFVFHFATKIKIKIYRTIILLVSLYGVKTGHSP